MASVFLFIDNTVAAQVPSAGWSEKLHIPSAKKSFQPAARNI